MQGERLRVLVLGGFGFIGRHTVAALRTQGCQISIGSRFPQRRARETVLPEACVEVHVERLLTAEQWLPLISGVDVVINCVGILRQRGRETYRRVHHLGPAALAAACAQGGQRLIHVSALGLEGGPRSRFLGCKRDGEAALRASGADWCIVRPSLLDAEHDGFGARWIRRVARWPLHPVPADATGRIAVLHVDDLAEVLARLAMRSTFGAAQGQDREFDLGGGQARTLVEFLADLRRLDTQRAARVVRIPALLAQLASHVCDLLHVTPLSFGHLELLRSDNCPQRNRLPELLGRSPRVIGRSACAPSAETSWREPGPAAVR